MWSKFGIAWALLSYGFAVLMVGAALGVSFLLQSLTHDRILFPFFAAVIVAGWIGGRGPAWSAVIMSLLAVDYFFAAPLYAFGVDGRDQAFFVPFLVAIVIAGWLGSLRKRAEIWSAERRGVGTDTSHSKVANREKATDQVIVLPD